MQKTKKQKYEQEIRKSLKNILNLDPEIVQYLKNILVQNQTILYRTYGKIHEMQLLRTLTLMEINFIIFIFLDILDKTKAMKAQDLKIGIIGGGIMGRLILNTLLVFTKQGLKTSNILVSTRQPHHLQFYTDNFGIKVFFDNDKIAEQAHIIFVATPATLDNWIILDLKKQIETKKNIYQVHESTRTSQASTILIQNSQSIDLNPALIRNSMESDIKSSASRASKKLQIPFNSENIIINPFIYVLTSDFTSQKSIKLFDFPVYVPHFRATDIQSLIQKLSSRFVNAEVQQLTKNQDNFIKQLELFLAQQLFKQKNQEQNLREGLNEKKNINQNIIRVLDFSCKQIEIYWKINNDFSKLKNYETIQVHKLYKEILGSQESYSETFLNKSRKWRMAYNNFIA